MLDQLVESKSNSRENTRRSEFLLGVFAIMVVVLLSGWTYSLFAKDYGMGGDDIELSTLVAPVPYLTKSRRQSPKKSPSRNNRTLT